MSPIQPQGESLRKAVKWISAEREANPNAKLHILIEQASMKFNLSPADGDFLLRTLKQEG